MTRLYAFWESHPPATDRPATNAIERYGPFGVAALGAFGILTALIIPLMLVIERKELGGGMTTTTSFNGLFLSCVNYPSKYNVDDECHFRIFPHKVSGVPQDRNACPSLLGEGKSGFTYAKQHALAVSANVAALLCLCLSIITVVLMWLRGRGTLRSARGSFASSFLCGLTGCSTIILYYIAINPCKKDICTAMNDAAGLDALVSCWALSPVGHVLAMLMVFAGGCCSQRWAPNPDAVDEAPAANPNTMRAEEMPAIGVPVTLPPPNAVVPPNAQLMYVPPSGPAPVMYVAQVPPAQVPPAQQGASPCQL